MNTVKAHLTAYLSQRPDYNPTKIDFGSFDRGAFYKQLATRNTAGREYRALSEGSQSVTLTGAGVTVPIEFAKNILELLRANLLWTSPGADGAIHRPQVVDMRSQLEVIPAWQADAAAVGSYIAENTQLTPGTAQLGYTQAQACTAASVQLISRQAMEHANVDWADLIESNTALAISRTMDAAALYGTGHSSNQPPGLLTSAYSGTLQSVSMGTNGGSFTAASGQYNPFMQAVDKCRTANEAGPLRCYTHPAVAASADAGLSTLNTYIAPPDYIREIWPPVQSTAFSRTEVQGTSSVTSSAVVLNPNRVLLPLRMGLTFHHLTERFSDFLQHGFLAYVRHDWAFPYSAAATRVQGILPASGF